MRTFVSLAAINAFPRDKKQLGHTLTVAVTYGQEYAPWKVNLRLTRPVVQSPLLPRWKRTPGKPLKTCCVSAARRMVCFGRSKPASSSACLPWAVCWYGCSWPFVMNSSPGKTPRRRRAIAWAIPGHRAPSRRCSEPGLSQFFWYLSCQICPVFQGLDHFPQLWLIGGVRVNCGIKYRMP